MKQKLALAVSLARAAWQNNPAYRNFLSKHGWKNKKIKTASDFFSLPIADKKNYILANNFAQLLGGSKPAFAYASSGSSGHPTFWFRNKTQEIAGGRLHQYLFSEIYGIKKQEPTLVIICFSMGIWVAGNYTAACCQWLSDQGFNLTTVTPGIEKHDIIKILKILAQNFHNVILAGYPSFVMNVLHEAKNQKVVLPTNLKILTAGDSFSEPWRDSLLALLNRRAVPQDIISLYGSADAGVMGFETPLTISLRRAAVKNKSLYSELFDDDKTQGALMQFNPRHIFFEHLQNELVLTANTAIPLIRYNIHDIGKVIEFEEIKKLIKNYALKLPMQKMSPWPLLLKKGRTDVAVTFYALNIYPEHIDMGVRHPKISKLLSGNFRAFNRMAKGHKQEQLIIELELKEKTGSSKKLTQLATEAITGALLRANSEYRKLHGTIGQKALPKIKLIERLGQAGNMTKNLLYIKGKKATMIG